MSIFNRGQPYKHELVHYCVYAYEIGTNKEYDDATCKNGNYHLRFTREKTEVTCKECLKGLK